MNEIAIDRLHGALILFGAPVRRFHEDVDGSNRITREPSGGWGN